VFFVWQKISKPNNGRKNLKKIPKLRLNWEIGVFYMKIVRNCGKLLIAFMLVLFIAPATAVYSSNM